MRPVTDIILTARERHIVASLALLAVTARLLWALGDRLSTEPTTATTEGTPS